MDPKKLVLGNEYEYHDGAGNIIRVRYTDSSMSKTPMYIFEAVGVDDGKQIVLATNDVRTKIFQLSRATYA